MKLTLFLVRAFFMKRLPIPKKKFIFIVLLIALVIGVGFAGYDYFWAKKYIFKTVSAEEQAKKEVAAVTNIIRQSIDLPPDEKAVMATVTDIDQLKSQQFFSSAQNGDVVLMYPEFGKALIYRPKDKRVVEFGAMVVPPAGEAEN